MRLCLLLLLCRNDIGRREGEGEGGGKEGGEWIGGHAGGGSDYIRQ